MSTHKSAPRRSTRLSTVSVSVKSEPAEEQEIVQPPAKKQKKSHPRKITTSASAETTSAKTTIKVKKDVQVKSERDGDHIDPSTASSSTDDIKPTLSEVNAATDVRKKRGRPSNASTKVEPSFLSSSALATTIVKHECGATVETEHTSTAGPSQISAQTSTVGVANKVQPDIKPKIENTKSPAKGKGKAKEKVVDPKKERLARMRAKCPKTTLDRYKRAISQRMFMIEREHVGEGSRQYEQFKVLGSTGNVYTVNIGVIPRCNCPDNLKGNKPCKHIIFVFIKVLKVPDESPIWYQMSLTPEEVEEVFAAAPPVPNGSVTVDLKVHKAYLHATGRGVDEQEVTEIDKNVNDESGGKRMDAVGEDCPVCYEEMTQQDLDGKLLTYDESLNGCGKPLHKECFQMWALTARNKGNDVTCVWCRSPWPTEDGGKGKGKATGPQYTSMGYLNMADAAGLSRQRDVSSYHWGSRYRHSD
ncbi:uncharacterized protein IL334_004162 [Kwoniella shivajii]|uniref:SWIM-type domain-containing protein n=1 Tax=Kwoniella shivajii TaxID=564305 RepID=A0ABZ1CZJ9_9TREE|nr:hypothetical protein IL334_004162 [Kwoniella shivajii]